MKIFITRSIPKISVELLKGVGFKVKVYRKNDIISRDELAKQSKNADGIISSLTDKFDKNMIDQLENCKIIANYAVGFNNIDIDYAAHKGIKVTNTPDVLTDATAEIAAALILSCARRIPEGERIMRNNEFYGWEPKLLRGIQLSGKTLGIIGAGRIGQATARKLKGFGLKIIYYNKSKKNDFEAELNAKKVSLNGLMKKSDFISIHLPLNEMTHHILNKSNLDLMKETAVLVNTARGEVVDENYLIKMLKKKRIFAAGFDVYENEPIVNKDLLSLENVVLLPHIGSSTFETRDKMAELTAKNVINVLTGKRPITPLN